MLLLSRSIHGLRTTVNSKNRFNNNLFSEKKRWPHEKTRGAINHRLIIIITSHKSDDNTGNNNSDQLSTNDAARVNLKLCPCLYLLVQ